MDIRKQVQAIQKSAISDPRFKHSDEVTVTAEDAAFMNRLFNSILPQFPAWRQTCPTDDDLNRLKMAWSKAIKRHMEKTGVQLNIKAGLIACEESESDWLISVGKFIKMCDQSDSIMPLAQRALDLFNGGQKQIDNVGQMVVGKHGFDLKKMKAADNNKQFIELYLGYAANNPIEAKESHLLTETVQLSEEQQKDADNRALIAQNQFLNKFKGEIAKEAKVEPMKLENVGVKTGSLKTYKKTPIQKEDEKQRQLKIAKGMCK